MSVSVREFLALGLQFGAQLRVVLDDAVVNDGDPGGAVRMRVALGRRAMGRPARVADADAAGQRGAFQHRCQIAELALGAAAFDMAVDEGSDAGAVIAAIFQPPQRVHQQRSRGTRSDHSDDAAHQLFVLCFAFRCSARIAAAPPGFCTCRPRAIASASGDILGDHAAGGHDRALAHRDRGNQRRVRADEGLCADPRPMLGGAVVIAGDRARADIRPRADLRVAQIGEVIRLCARAQVGRLQLDEIADMRSHAEGRSWAQSRERTDDRAGPDGAAFQVAEGTDLGSLLHGHAGTEHDSGSDRYIRREARIEAEEYAGRVRHRDPFFHRRVSQSALEHGLGFGEFDPGVDAAQFVEWRLDRRDVLAFGRCEGHDVGQVVFALGVVIAHGPHPARHV